jgi:hypothetical protein
MYKTVREFAFEVPGSAEKNELQAILERIPTHYQQLIVLVKNPTTGKSVGFRAKKHEKQANGKFCVFMQI